MIEIEPNWELEHPEDEINAFLQTDVFIPADMSSAPLDELLEALRHAFTSTYDPSGGAKFAAFSFPNNPRLNWFVSHWGADEFDFLTALLRSSAFQTALPELTLGEMEIKWEWSSPYTFDGVLAELLVSGGAYHEFEGTGRQAKDLGMRVCNSLFGDRFEDVKIYKTRQCWSNWFHGVAWDYTYIGVDKASLKVWILCITDSD